MRHKVLDSKEGAVENLKSADSYNLIDISTISKKDTTENSREVLEEEKSIGRTIQKCPNNQYSKYVQKFNADAKNLQSGHFKIEGNSRDGPRHTQYRKDIQRFDIGIKDDLDLHQTLKQFGQTP